MTDGKNILRKWCALQRPLERRIAELEELIQAQAGCTFNLDSAKEVGEVLFERLRLKVPACALKGNSRQPSTSHEVRCLTVAKWPLQLWGLSK